MPTPPQTSHAFTQVPSDSRERRLYLLEVFAQHLFWMRNERLQTLRKLLTDEEFRQQKLGTIHRKPFEAMAALGPDACEAACDVSKAAIDQYMQDILALLTNIGGDLRFGPDHSVKYRLILEVVETKTDKLVTEEVINRGEGRGFFLPGNFGRWLNEYRSHGNPV